MRSQLWGYICCVTEWQIIVRFTFLNTVVFLTTTKPYVGILANVFKGVSLKQECSVHDEPLPLLDFECI